MFNTATDRDFTKNFLISCGAHAALVLLAYLGGSAIMKVLNVNDNVEIIRASVRVDVVGMPKFTVQELRDMQNEAATKPEPEVKGAVEEVKAKENESEDIIKKDDLVIEEEGKKKKSSFLSLINDYSQKKVAAKEKNRGSKSGKNKDINNLILEGNRLSKGGALVGDYSAGDNSDFSAYVQGMPEIVRPFWNLPSYLQDKNLRCRIKIYLSTSGQLLSTDVFESSGQSEFDARAIKAVKDAAPYPAPSEVVGQRLTKSGIILGFPL